MRNQVVVAILLIVLAGCVHSLHAVYGEDDVIFDSSLLGEWIGDRESWTVTRADENAYRILHADDKGRPGVFIGHLFKIGDSYFVDLAPVRTDIRDSEFYQGHHLATHTFFQVVRLRPTPQIASFSHDWLRDHLAENPSALRHERIGSEIVITAPTREIQEFLLRHRMDNGAFIAGKPWRRATATGTGGAS